MICPHCKTVTDDQAGYCGKCGARVAITPPGDAIAAMRASVRAAVDNTVMNFNERTERFALVIAPAVLTVLLQAQWEAAKKTGTSALTEAQIAGSIVNIAHEIDHQLANLERENMSP